MRKRQYTVAEILARAENRFFPSRRNFERNEFPSKV